EVRVAVIGICLPLLSIDQDVAVRCFLAACDMDDDRVLACHHLDTFLAYACRSHLSQIEPLILRMVSHVKHRSDVEGPCVVPADGSAEFVVAGSWGSPSGKVTDVAGRTTPLVFERAQSRRMCAFDRTAEKGFYTVEVTGGTTEQPKRGTTAFAVNLSPGESNFEQITDDKLSDLFPGIEVTLVDASAEAQQAHGSIGQQGQEVWRWLIFFLFFIICVEFLLSTLGGQTLDEEEPPTVSERIRNLSPGTWVGRMTGVGSGTESK
ncbi:MAG: hypothetical protein IH884_09770, partial [Myxococcales bacterium]|nr:hypothetical protein [Myxococcales bacterium]